MPVIKIEQPINTKVTVLAFLSRFTDAEAIAIDLAGIGATVEAATIRRHMMKVTSATYIDLSSPTLRESLMLLENVGILAEGRVNEIVTAPIRQDEVPRI